MQALKYLEDRFDTFTFRVKVGLFLLPLIIITGLAFFFFQEVNTERRQIFPKNEIDLRNINMKENIVDILKDIERYSLDNEITIYLLKKDYRYIKLEAFSSIKKRVLFLKYLEELNNFSKIRSFELLDEKLIVEIDFKKFYEKRNFIVKDDIEVFKEKEKKRNLILQAIVDDKVLVNERWLKVNENIDSFVLKKIENSKAIFENQYKKLILKLHKNEDL